jgi:hypothetical protein
MKTVMTRPSPGWTVTKYSYCRKNQLRKTRKDDKPVRFLCAISCRHC